MTTSLNKIFGAWCSLCLRGLKLRTRPAFSLFQINWAACSRYLSGRKAIFSEVS